MARLELGTIVRVLSINGQADLVGDDAWGVVVEDHEPHSGSDIYVMLIRWGGEEGLSSRWNGFGRGWFLMDREYEPVPDEQVPDEIWAELAKTRLVDG